jgi:hypothetical protein
MNITFTPAASGTRNAALVVTDNASGVAGSTQTVRLAGTAVDFAVSSTTTTQNVAEGAQAQYTINVASPVGAFTGSTPPPSPWSSAVLEKRRGRYDRRLLPEARLLLRRAAFL